MILEQLDKQLHQHFFKTEIQLDNIVFYPLELQTSSHGLQIIIWTNYKWNSIIGSLLHIVPFCEGSNKKPEGFAKQK